MNYDTIKKNISTTHTLNTINYFQSNVHVAEQQTNPSPNLLFQPLSLVDHSLNEQAECAGGSSREEDRLERNRFREKKVPGPQDRIKGGPRRVFPVFDSPAGHHSSCCPYLTRRIRLEYVVERVSRNQGHAMKLFRTVVHPLSRMNLEFARERRNLFSPLGLILDSW